MSFGGTEILLILGVIILFFGARKIPELARGLGQGITEFRKVSDKLDQEPEEEKQQQPSP